MYSVQKVRIEYSKKGALRYIGHLDLMHTFFRAFKRANLPVSYTQGFNPHVKCSFSPALPLGFESEDEYIELYLDKKIDVSDALNSLQKNLPEGVTIHNIKIVPLFGKSSTTKIKAVAYRINLNEFSTNSTVSPRLDKEDIQEKIRNFMDREEVLLVDRKGRRVNIRPLILSIESGSEGNIRILIKTKGEFSLNPRIIIKALLGVKDEDLAFVRFTREKFLFW
jgi:radical SAM-linked protein